MGGIGFLRLISKLLTCCSLASSYSPVRLSAPSSSSNLNELLSAYSVASELPPSLRAAVSFRFRVMSYNIQQMKSFLGLLALDQTRRLDKLIKALAELDESNCPDAIVFQEVFKGEAETALKTHLQKLYPYSTERILNCNSKGWTTNSGMFCSGMGPFISGGTQVFSRYPIREAHAYAFQHLAGWDARSKKGAVLTKILVPARETPVDLSLGVAGATSVLNKFVAANAFKRAFFNSTSDWSFSWISRTVPAIVYIKLPNAVKVSAFSFRIRPEPAVALSPDWYLKFSPLEFELVGSNDCDKWTTIIRVKIRKWRTGDDGKKWIVPEETQKLFTCIGIKVLRVQNFNRVPEAAIHDAKFWENRWNTEMTSLDCRIEDRVKYHKGFNTADYRLEPVANMVACKQQCIIESPRCVGFTFEKSSKYCWLKTKMVARTPNKPGYVSGICNVTARVKGRAIWLMGTHMQADDEEEIRVKDEKEFTDWIDKKTSQQDPVIIAGDFNVENRAEPKEYKTMRKMTRLSINYTFSSPGSFSAETNMIAKLNCYPAHCPLSYDDTLDYIGYRRDRVKPIYAPEMRVLPVKANEPWYWRRLYGEWKQPGKRSVYTYAGRFPVFWERPGKPSLYYDGYYRDYADHYPVVNDFYY